VLTRIATSITAVTATSLWSETLGPGAKPRDHDLSTQATYLDSALALRYISVWRAQAVCYWTWNLYLTLTGSFYLANASLYFFLEAAIRLLTFE
jgi:hypothetical protein